MKDTVRRLIETFLRVQSFGQEHAAHFPPTSFAAQQFSMIDDVLQGLEASTSEQAAGLSAARQITSGKAAARDELMRDLEAIYRTARPMTAATPGLLEQFRIPHNLSDQDVLAAARAVAGAARPLKAEFVKRGMPADFVEDLEVDTQAFEDAIARKIDTRDSHVTATAAIDDLIEHGVRALRELDPIVRNTFADDPSKLAAWLSASRVERRARRNNDQTPPTPTA